MSANIDTVTIFTDGAASPNPGPGGYGVILIRNGQRRELSGGFRKTTNNRMEILAAIVGLREMNGEKSTVAIHSDSKYVVDMFTGGYAAQWRRNGWRRQKGKAPALNPDLWEELLNLAALHDVRFEWVRGHADNADNTRCDELDVTARQGNDLPPDVGYESASARQRPAQPSLFAHFDLT
ncbi:MAG: ribonuclease HI [Lentisphaerae bacterium]|nr:ribonuclease HI [Lentisphaerota bacterium]